MTLEWGDRGSANGRGPPDPSQERTLHVICLCQINRNEGPGVCSHEGSGGLGRGPSDWLRQITWGVRSREGTGPLPKINKFLTFDSNVLKIFFFWGHCDRLYNKFIRRTGTFIDSVLISCSRLVTHNSYHDYVKDGGDLNACIIFTDIICSCLQIYLNRSPYQGL